MSTPPTALGAGMSAALPFDPTCPWRASCRSRRITTSSGLLRHLQKFHNLTLSGRDRWLSQLCNPADYGALEAALRASGNWLCTTCFKPHALGVHLCSTYPDTCQRLWNLQDGLLPADVNVLPGIPRPAQSSTQQGACGCPALGTSGCPNHRPGCQCPPPPGRPRASLDPQPHRAFPHPRNTGGQAKSVQMSLDSVAAVMGSLLPWSTRSSPLVITHTGGFPDPHGYCGRLLCARPSRLLWIQARNQHGWSS